MTTEERIVELENNCKAMTDEIEKLKTELVEKNKRETETVWQPKRYDAYMYIGSDGGVYSSILEDPALERPQMHIYYNNVYPSYNKTQEHLEWYRDNVLRVQNRLMQLHELLCSDYFPDWDTDKGKWAISYDSEYKCFSCAPWYCMNYFIVCFTKEAAEKACEILNREKFMME